MAENKEIRNEILKHFEIHLDSEGFQKKGNSLIRESDTGLFQVIDFVLGQNYSITHNHLGLGFGIYTEEWFKHLNFGNKPKNINGSHCELKYDFNESIPKDNNACWISLNQNINSVFKKSKKIFDSYFIPELNKLRTRKTIIDQWKLRGNDIGLPSRGRLSISILLWYLNEKVEARKLIDLELNENKNKPYFEFVERKLNELLKTAP